MPMGQLGLDLAGPKAKLLRAKEHLDAMERETDRLMEDYPCTFSASEVDNHGWTIVKLHVKPIPDITLGVIFGEYMHNLRSALDQSVTYLATASGAESTTKHEFPIFDSQVAFRKKVGPLDAPKKGGPLGSIGHGLDIIERVQPYHLGSDAHAHHAHPLWHLHRFSNTDKHRVTASLVPFIDELDLSSKPQGAIREIKWSRIPFPMIPHESGLPTVWPDDTEYEIGRVRYAVPFIGKANLDIQVNTKVAFAVRAVGDLEGEAFCPEVLIECHEYVSSIVEAFEAL